MKLTTNSSNDSNQCLPGDPCMERSTDAAYAKAWDCAAIRTMPLASVLYLALFGDLAIKA